MTTSEFIDRYWNYYLFIEKKFIATTDYVALVKPNFETYSNEFVSLLQLIGSENDVIIKECCGYPGDRYKNMKNYKVDLVSKYPNLPNEEIRVRNSLISIKPFEDIQQNSMRWWNAYNSVKHNRVNSFSSAKVINVLYGIMGLFLLNRLFLYELDRNHYFLMNQSSLLKTTGWGEQAKNAMIIDNGDPCLLFENDD